ncbi:MAG: hypothetical protein ACP5MZ_03510 [Candidatus Micrarchaeia archaeon]
MLIIIAVAVLFLSLSHHNSVYVAKVLIPNLNSSNVASVIHNATYVPILKGELTSFEGALKLQGYLESSMTTFNLSQGYNKSNFPYIISSSVFLMSNSSSAKAALDSILASSKNQSSSGPTFTAFDYSSSSGNTTIYIGSSVSIFNASAINSSAEKLLNLPVYQYTSVFVYGNYTITIVLNSFSSNPLYNIYATRLSEALIKQMQNE